KEQLQGLLDGGIDLIILETFTNLEHIRTALDLCKKETKLPVIAQMAFLEGTRTAMASNVKTIVKELINAGADIVGANCGSGPRYTLDVIKALSGYTDMFISAQPNAGYPQIVDGRTVYVTSPEYFAHNSMKLAEAGANIIGGCCGTTPEHIRHIALELKDRKPYKRQAHISSVIEFKEAPGAVIEKDRSVLSKIIVELLPPKTAQTEKLIDTAKMLKEKGARVLSFPENPLARVRMSSIAAAGIVKNSTGLDAIFHYTCRDRSLIGLQSDILGAHALGLRSVLAVTGDPVSLGNSPEASPVFDVDSIKLVKLIANMKREMGIDLKIGVAFNPNFIDMAPQIARLQKKINAGAQFAMTQPVFDRNKICEIKEKTEKLAIPVYIGILPLVSRKNAEFLHNEVPGMQIPLDIRKRMDVKEGKDARQEGVSIALELMNSCSSFVDGFYLISPMHLYEISGQILEKIQNK
ncbi:MAG TPA: bifunctional homocysteine S-methyltransferase/methylenetetrahydrofolate reductase, partial [Candidatus Omnitrophota bacterium]|nr:bifunctional homocysteine S-methyltransferase/methylenetetrahydrofolate reductase [Candidatus Omnitrophota bacterium]